MPRKRIAKPKPGDARFHNPERQEEAHRMLEIAKKQEQKYILKHVRVDSNPFVWVYDYKLTTAKVHTCVNCKTINVLTDEDRDGDIVAGYCKKCEHPI